ncbi:hypothetical protein ABZP36_014227 [Zizania latifolia]
MASESLQCKIGDDDLIHAQTLALRVSIHCEGCKKKVKKVLLRVEGVYKCDIDGRSNKATVAVTGKVSADTLIGKLRRAGKHAQQWHAQQWPEKQKQQQPQRQQNQSCGTQSQEETKNQAAEPDGGEPAEKPASSDAAEPGDPKASPEERKKITGETAAPAEVGTESTNANASGSAGDGAETGAAQQTGEPKRRMKQQQEKAGEAIMAVAALTQGSHTTHLPAAAPLHQFPQQQPVHIMSYNVARPSASGAYYAAAPVALPAPASARPPPPPLPPREHPFLYSPYYSQPPPYRYSYYHHYNGGHATTPPQRSAASPARNSYGDLFSDDNVNSCRVM